MERLRIACAQINTNVGDIAANVASILDAMAWAESHHADLVLLPELAVTGYPPEDLVLRDGFVDANLEGLQQIAAASRETTAVVGFIDRVSFDGPDDDAVARGIANAAAVVSHGRIGGVYHKVLLPNYGVFDEARYFVRGRQPGRIWLLDGVPLGISVCEDIWSPTGPPAVQADGGAVVLLNINGSPYHEGKGRERARLLASEARRSGVPVVYLNMVGGQDELVFDGESMVFDGAGAEIYMASQFTEERFIVDLPVGRPQAPPAGAVPLPGVRGRGTAGPAPPATMPRLSEEAEVYTALVTGLRDYVGKNGFHDVVVGLSGGIDSALTCAIAVDALGPDAVLGVTMPTRYSSEGSRRDSEDLAKRLGCRFDVVPIDDVFAAYLETLAPVFADTPPGVAEENLQARIRGAVLMAISNKFGSMVVATGNKSEMAVGYATLYGDMAGGFAVLKDVFKTTVYRLAEWRNRDIEVIPRAIIEKPPSAELRPGQLDTDSLPDYDILDEILRRYVELDMSVDSVVGGGLDLDLVRMVARMVDRNEYKRRQAPPGVRISRKAFGRDRRLPITNGYRPS
ncbi:MAG TPA: NAD+ synthase [Acidimicrobiia bacterium]|jgi:NAD+ synthase (glutamine-hydrolysing)